MLAIALALLPLAAAPQDAAPPTAQELRAALDAMRAGAPGEPSFDAAAPRLPALIRSRSGWFVSSGAWLAGQHRRTDCVPDLLDALGHENRRATGMSDRQKGYVLDALLRLGAAVPTKALVARIEEETLAETYLLLARAEEPDVGALRALMDAAPTVNGAHWAAACLLAHLDADGLAQRVLLREALPVTVRVRDPGDQLSYHGGFGGSVNMSSHSNWPPRVAWDVVLPRTDQELDGATGARQSDPRKLKGPRRVPDRERLALRGRLLDHLLGECAERGLVGAPPDLDVDWTSASAYERALRGHLDDVRERLLRVALRLEARGKLRDARGVMERVRLRVVIQDLRTTEGAPALPRPPALPWVVYAED